MQLLLVPLIGPFHLRSPAYNAVSVRDLVAAWQPHALATTALTADEMLDPAWQDTPEIALPLAVIPWTARSGLPFHAVGEASPEPGAEEDFRRYLEPYPEMRRRVAEVDSLQQDISAELQKPLTAEAIVRELVPAIRSFQEEREQAFTDGPASEWLRQRMDSCWRRLLELDVERLAVLAPVDHLPFLQDAQRGSGFESSPLPSTIATPEARERALLDYAFRVDVNEPAQLLQRLRELAGAEARYHEANLLLSSGHGLEALELLERTSRGDFSSPYFLPGYLLARLGQLRDLASRRNDALRAYRGVLALDYAPAEASEAARAGLEAPFSP